MVFSLSLENIFYSKKKIRLKSKKFRKFSEFSPFSMVGDFSVFMQVGKILTIFDANPRNESLRISPS